jgi:hypothetical protein
VSRFVWAAGAQVRLAAEVFGARYAALAAQHGEVTAQHVVDDAAPRHSPLHAAFEWDNRKAGEAWRLAQAGHLLRALRVVDDAVDRLNRPQRYLIAVRPAEARPVRWKAYVPLREALEDPERRVEVFQRALRELAAFEAKYRELQELDAVWTAVRQLQLEASAPAVG